MLSLRCWVADLYKISRRFVWHGWLVPACGGTTLFASVVAVGLFLTQPTFSIASAGPCPEIDALLYKGRDDGLLYRCELLERLTARGLILSSPIGQQILREFLRPHETILVLNGEAALPKPVLVYLFGEFPHTAQLINFYKKSNYQVIYTKPDRSQFFATNNRSMQATVDILDRSESVVSNNYLFFENGRAKLMFWRFTGRSIVEINLMKHQEQTAYKVTIHLFSSSGVFHAFFESPLFAYLMRSIFKKIMGDIVDSARQLAAANDTPTSLDPVFAAGLLRRLK